MGSTSAESNRGMWRHAVPLLLNHATSSQRENSLSRYPGPWSQGDTESPSLETSLSKLVSLFCNQEGFTISVKHRTRGYECVWCVFWCIDHHVYDYLLSNHLQCWKSLTKSSALLKGNLGCLFFGHCSSHNSLSFSHPYRDIMLRNSWLTVNISAIILKSYSKIIISQINLAVLRTFPNYDITLLYK